MEGDCIYSMMGLTIQVILLKIKHRELEFTPAKQKRPSKEYGLQID